MASRESIVRSAMTVGDYREVECAHPNSRLETLSFDHIYCNLCCGHFFLERTDFARESTLKLKNEKLNGIIKEIQNIIDVNCIGEVDGD